MTTEIRFNDVEEFLDEVRRAPPTDRVVRITHRVTPTRISSTVRHVEVVATYVTAGGTRLIEFVQYVGQLWGIEPGDEKILARTDKIRATLESGIAAAELEIRSGICAITGPSSFPPAHEFSEDLRVVRDAFQQVRRTIAAEGVARSAPLPLPSGHAEQSVADALEQLDRAIGHLQDAEVCAPSTIIGRIDATLRKQAHDLDIVRQCLGRIAAHLDVPGAPVVDEVTP